VLLALPQVEHEAASFSQVDHDAVDIAGLGCVNLVELFKPFAGGGQLVGGRSSSVSTRHTSRFLLAPGSSAMAFAETATPLTRVTKRIVTGETSGRSSVASCPTTY
jgi:hypothetical protein